MRASLFLAFLALVSCGSSTEPGPPPGAYRILFVGNSLTYTNDLPLMVEAIGRAGGDTFYTKTLAYPDWGLQDHWETGDAPGEIASDQWDMVVMQQGPSSLEASRVDLLFWGKKFGDLAHIHGVCPAFYMVWPAKANIGTFDAVFAHYKEVADSNAGLFLPAGDAWRAAWARDASYPLYGGDNFHPSPLGTYLAALTIYSEITGKNPVGNTATIEGMTLDAADRQAIQESAWEAAYGVERRCGAP